MDKTIVYNKTVRKCSLGAGVGLLLLVSLAAMDGISFQETWGWIFGVLLCGFAAIHPVLTVYDQCAAKYGERWWFKISVWLVSTASVLLMAVISMIWRVLRGDGSEELDDRTATGSVFKDPLHLTDAVYDQSHEVYYGNERPFPFDR